MKKGKSAQSSGKGEKKKNQRADAPPPLQESVSVTASTSDNTNISKQDIELVQHLIERCLQLYMTRDEVVKTLLARARIDPAFTALVWQKLAEENPNFFRNYYIRLKVKKQILMFNHLLENQYRLMNYQPMPPHKIPLVPMHHLHPMPMGYPLLPHHPQMYHHVQGHPQFDATGMSSCHVVPGIPAPANFQPMMRMNSTNHMMVDTTTPQVIPPNSGEMAAVSPASVASSGHFPFTAMDAAASVLDTAGFTSGGGGGEAGTSGDSPRPFDQIPWNFSLSDLTADLTNLEELGVIGNYPGSPFLHSDSDILLDSPEQEDIDEFFADSVPGPPCSTSDEDNKLL